MKTTDRFVRPELKLLCIIFLSALFAVSPSAAQEDYSLCEQTVTNQDQLAGVFNCDTFCLPIDPPAFREWLIDPQFLWADFASLPAEFGAAFAQSQEQVQGVTVLKVRLMRFPLTGETLVELLSSTNTLALAAPAGYTTNQVDSSSRFSLQAWRQWIDWGALDANTTPTLSVDVSLADVQGKAAYDEAMAADEQQSAMLGGTMFMDLSESGDMATSSPCPGNETNDFQISSITYDQNALTATITFPSCSTRIYSVESADDLLSNTVWSFQKSMVGLDGSTSWSDSNAGSVDHRFYRARRWLYSDDSDGDGFSAYLEALYGTDPNSPTSTVYGALYGILDGPYNTVTNADGFTYSLSGVPGAYLVNSNVWLVFDTSLYTSAPSNTVNVSTNLFPNGDPGTNEQFTVSSRGRMLNYAAGSNATNGFGHIDGGIFFNVDATYLYIGVAGLYLDNGCCANELLIFLDTTDGAHNGASNMANTVTSFGPPALAQAHNLSFSNSYFTPNVGIIVGSRTGGGANSTNLSVNGTKFGQGVFALSPTNNATVTDFPGFSTAGNSRIAEWGDFSIVNPPTNTDTNSANGGIEIAIRKDYLGLTNTTSFKAAAIFCGGPNGTQGYFSTTAYGESVSGGFGNNATTLIGATVTLTTNAAPAYTPFMVDDSAVMMQVFYWNVPTNSSPDGDWYNVLAGQATDMATSGITSVWMPPPYKGNSTNSCTGCTGTSNSTGYDPYDHYDLGNYRKTPDAPSSNTLYGSRAELQGAVNALVSNNISPYVDIVMNHMQGGQSFTYNGASGYFKKTPADFYTNNLACYPFHRDMDFVDEVNQTTPHMQQALEAWGEWLTASVGFNGYRFDHTSGIEPWFLSEWLRMPTMSNKFAVLEFTPYPKAGGTLREYLTWINLVDQRASLFDFPLHDSLVQLCATGSFNMATLTNAGLVAVAPQFAVTFVENHDTIRPCPDNSNVGIPRDKILGYAYILVSPGYPCVFYHDYYESPNRIVTNTCQDGKNFAFTGSPLKPQIDRLIKARQLYAHGTNNYLSVSNRQDLYIVKRVGADGTNGCILAINRHLTSTLSDTVNTLWPSGTLLTDFIDTNTTVTVGNGGTATLSVPARSYRVYVHQ